MSAGTGWLARRCVLAAALLAVTALIGGCRAAERRVTEICERFGRDTFAAACEALLVRTRDAMARLTVDTQELTSNRACR